MDITDLKNAVLDAVRRQLMLVEIWHEAEPNPCGCGHEDDDQASLEQLVHLLLDEHLVNFRLWHVEDEARRTDVDAGVIAGCKRTIDGLNQQRNDLIERVDQCLVVLLQDVLPEDAAERYNTETIGSALDRLSILCLKIYHMDEQARRPGAEPSHAETCRKKLAVLASQHKDLAGAVLELLDDYACGAKRPRVYYQFKMYNDPELNPALQRESKA